MKGIGKRVSIGFISIVVMLMISGAFSLATLLNLSDDTGKILERNRTNMLQAKNLLSLAQRHNRMVMHFAVLSDAKYVDSCRVAIESLTAEAERMRGLVASSWVDSIASGVENLKVVTACYMAENAISSSSEDAFLAESASEEDAATAEIPQGSTSVKNIPAIGVDWYEKEYTVAMDSFLARLDRYTAHVSDPLTESAATLGEKVKLPVKMVLVALVVMIAIVLMFFFFVYVYGVRPIRGMNKSLGEYIRYGKPFRVKSELIDELAELNHNIDALTTRSRNNK